MLGQVGNGGFLELGDADPAVTGFDDFRFDALNLDDFARQGEFDRLALAFAQNAQADRGFGFAAHFLDGIGQIIEDGDLRDMIELIEQQVNNSDYTAMDIAAAFLKQAIGGVELSKEDHEFDDALAGDTGAEEGMVRLFINIGKSQRIRPGDILGAVAGEAKIPGKLVGAIDMYDNYTFVEVPQEYGKDVLKAMKNVKIKGKSVNVEPANAR